MSRTTDKAVVCRTVGGGARPYVVAQARRGVLRLCRVVHHGQAVLIASEWNAGDYTLTPGDLRRFPVADQLPEVTP